MKRLDGGNNPSDGSDPSKRHRQDQQIAFEQDSAEIAALLRGQHEIEQSNEETNPDASNRESESSCNGGETISDGRASDSHDRQPNEINRAREVVDTNSHVIVVDVPQSLENGYGTGNGNNNVPFVPSSDEEGDADDSRAWLSAPAGERRAPRVGNDFQAELPGPEGK